MIGSLRDTLTMSKTLTPRRVANAGKVLASYYRSRATGIARQKGMPISLAIEPTTSCNLRCPECPSGLRSFTRPTGMLDPLLYEKIIEELAPTLSYLTFYFQGEPYLHPSFLTMVQFAARLGIYTATSTNAHYLSEDVARKTVQSGLHRLIISIDGTTQETYEAYRRGGKLERVIEGAQNVIRWKKELSSATPHICFQFLVVKPNEHQIGDMRNLRDRLGADQLTLKTAQLYDYVNGSPLMPSGERYSRYRRTAAGTFELKNKLLNHCWKMWNSAVVTWDGRVIPCCFDKDAAHELGSVRAASFSDIWFGERYHAFRTSLLKSRGEIDICKNCTEGTRVWVAPPSS